jgi:hypothetical protein
MAIYSFLKPHARKGEDKEKFHPLNYADVYAYILGENPFPNVLEMAIKI